MHLHTHTRLCVDVVDCLFVHVADLKWLEFAGTTCGGDRYKIPQATMERCEIILIDAWLDRPRSDEQTL